MFDGHVVALLPTPTTACGLRTHARTRHHRRERPVHAGHRHAGVGPADGVERGEEAVDACDAHVVEPVHLLLFCVGVNYSWTGWLGRVHINIHHP